MRRCYAFLLLFSVSCAAFAQAFPSRPIEFIVHTSAGGGTDIFGRVVAEIIAREKLLNQPINVINRAGGGGAIAYTYTKSKRGDPHTVAVVASLAMITQTLRPELDLGMEHYTPIAFLKSPETIVASVTSPGGSGRLLVWLLEKETGAKFKSVSFKSGGDAIIQVMGGHTQFTTENISEGYGAVEGKKLRVLAVTSLTRLSIVPDAPTLKEAGINLHVGTGRGFAMPAGVPKEAAATMEATLARVYKSAQWKEHADKNFYENIWMGSAEYAKHLAERRAQHGEFLKAVGIMK
jgi:putative tricarboxylic transport membrane protein